MNASLRSPDVVVIGGGLSGLAASVELASRGATVTLCEQTRRLGGRCYSYSDPKTGDVVDNGQHVLLGAYRHALKYLDTIGSGRFLRKEGALRIPLHHPEKGFAEFSVQPLPKPLDLTAAMLKFPLLSISERRRLLNVGMALRAWNPRLEESLSELTVAEWLSGLGQSHESMECLWNPISVSVMNESPETASALLFARSLHAAFLGKKSDSSILLPTVGQTDLYVTGAIEFLEGRNAAILMNSEVRRLEMRDTAVTRISLANGGTLTPRYVVSAVPYFSLGKILPETLLDEAPFSGLAKIRSSPIVSLHLWFEKEFLGEEFLGLIGSRIQWLFNRRRILSPSGGRGRGGYVSAVISGARSFVSLPRDRLVAMALEEIRGIFPSTGNLLAATVIKEKRATFSPTCQVEGFRPPARTPVTNLLLAGDWTATGLPATIEGAVMSGMTAARCIP